MCCLNKVKKILILTFKIFENRLRSPIAIYTDFECFTKTISSCHPNPKKVLQKNTKHTNLQEFLIILFEIIENLNQFWTQNKTKILQRYLCKNLKEVYKKFGGVNRRFYLWLTNRGGARHFHLGGPLEGPVLQQGELSMVGVGLSERDLLQWHDVTRKILGGHWRGQAKFLGGSGLPWHPPSSASADEDELNFQNATFCWIQNFKNQKKNRLFFTIFKIMFHIYLQRFGKIWGKNFCNAMYWRKIYVDYKNVSDRKKLKSKKIDCFNS